MASVASLSTAAMSDRLCLVSGTTAPPPPAVAAPPPAAAARPPDVLEALSDGMSDDEWVLMNDPEDDTPEERLLIFDVARAAQDARADVQYDRERRRLQGEEIHVLYAREKTTIVWTVSDDEDDIEEDEEEKITEVGLTNFNF